MILMIEIIIIFSIYIIILASRIFVSLYKENILCNLIGSEAIGLLNINRDEINLKTVSFNNPCPQQLSNPIALRLENGKVCTLFDHFISSSNFGGASTSTTFIANSAVIGDSAWDEKTQIKGFTLSFENSKIALFSPQIKPDQNDKTLNSVIIEGYTPRFNVKIWLSKSDHYTVMAKSSNIEPMISINYHEPCDYGVHTLDIFCLMSFFSISIGAHISPKLLKISPYEKEYADPSFDNYYIWNKTKETNKHLHHSESIFQIVNTEETHTTQSCLEHWLKRGNTWKEPNSFMMKAFYINNIIDIDRLLNSFCWYESIPRAKERPKDKPNLKPVIESAYSKISELGLKFTKDRLTTLISKLNEKSLTKIIEEDIERLTNHFGEYLVPQKLRTNFKPLIKLRGKAAHGNNIQHEDFLNTKRCIHLLEYLSFLLMLIELPLSNKSLTRIENNEIYKNFYYSYKE